MLSLDLSALLAGSSLRGAFEQKFKSLLKDIEAEVHHFIFVIASNYYIANLMFREEMSSFSLMKSVSTVLQLTRNDGLFMLECVFIRHALQSWEI